MNFKKKDVGAPGLSVFIPSFQAEEIEDFDLIYRHSDYPRYRERQHCHVANM